jgi:O-succinylbenzoic acid--CoA ligase
MAVILAGVPLTSLTGVSSLRPVSGDAQEILALLCDWDAADDPEPLVIETSGSTGRPKRVLLSRAALRASADATHARLGGPGRWELNLPPTYVAGVQVLFRTLRAGDGADRSYVSMVPTQLVRMRDRWESLTVYDAVLVGGGPLDPAVRAEAEAAGVPIVQTYGMSETCGGCVYDGVPLDGVEVKIEDDGAVLLRGPVLFDGYQGEPERTAGAFRDGWLVTDDLGHWAADGLLRIDGRTDDMIITGGVKVPAHAVSLAVAEHPDVEAVEVLGVPDVEWGERVVAFVVSSEPVLLEDLRDLVAPRSWAPRQLVRLPELPRLSNGKTDRVLLRTLAADD